MRTPLSLFGNDEIIEKLKHHSALVNHCYQFQIVACIMANDTFCKQYRIRLL